MSNVYRPGWRRQPWIVWALSALFVGAYALFSVQSESVQNQLVDAFALIPARFDAQNQDHFTAWYEAVFPIFGHVFLHGGWLHVGINTLVFMQDAVRGAAHGHAALSVAVLPFRHWLGGRIYSAEFA